MSIVSAKKFGNHNTHSMYGDVLTASDGDGMMHSTGGMRERFLGDSRLLEIQAMYSEMARSPLPGDEQVIHLLEFEQKVIESGDEVSFESVLDTYPDLPTYIADTTKADAELHAQIAEVAGDDDGVQWFVEKPTEYLEQLSRDDSLKILHALQEAAVRAQENAQSHALAA